MDILDLVIAEQARRQEEARRARTQRPALRIPSPEIHRDEYAEHKPIVSTPSWSGEVYEGDEVDFISDLFVV